MELRHLRYFLAVAEELSFSKASQRLRIAQPAISRAIQELEGALGVELLSRTRRSVALTPAGAVMLREVVLLLQRFDDVVRRVKRTAAGEEGELRLGYVGPPTQLFLGGLLMEFRRRYPHVTVELEERTPERVWDMVARGQAAIGITRPVSVRHGLGLRTLLLHQERLCAAIPSEHPLAGSNVIRWRQLENEPLIILARREGVSLHDAILAACRRAGFTPKLAHTPNLITTALNHAEGGAGIAVIPESICTPRPAASLTYCPLSPPQTVDLVMVWSDQNDSPTAVAFRSLVREKSTAGLAWPKSTTRKGTGRITSPDSRRRRVTSPRQNSAKELVRRP